MMEKSELLYRIVVNPKVMVGKPVIRGTRLTVQYILGLLAHDATIDEILQEYSDLTREDIQTCLLFAREFLCRHWSCGSHCSPQGLIGEYYTGE